MRQFTFVYLAVSSTISAQDICNKIKGKRCRLNPNKYCKFGKDCPDTATCVRFDSLEFQCNDVGNDEKCDNQVDTLCEPKKNQQKQARSNQESQTQTIEQDTPPATPDQTQPIKAVANPTSASTSARTEANEQVTAQETETDDGIGTNEDEGMSSPALPKPPGISFSLPVPIPVLTSNTLSSSTSTHVPTPLLPPTSNLKPGSVSAPTKTKVPVIVPAPMPMDKSTSSDLAFLLVLVITVLMMMLFSYQCITAYYHKDQQDDESDKPHEEIAAIKLQRQSPMLGDCHNSSHSPYYPSLNHDSSPVFNQEPTRMNKKTPFRRNDGLDYV